eukprot:5074052-Amphidinium_carterae.1
MTKVHGPEKLADLMTKFLDAETMCKHSIEEARTGGPEKVTRKESPVLALLSLTRKRETLERVQQQHPQNPSRWCTQPREGG